MNNDEARQSLAQAQQARSAAGRLRIPVPLSLLGATAAGAGVALLGQSSARGWGHVVVLTVGILLVAGAILLPNSYRARRGLHGFHGRPRSDNLVLLICAIALLIVGLDANSTLSVIYLGIGLAVAVSYFLLLRGRLGATE